MVARVSPVVPPYCDEHPATPVIFILDPPFVHVADQSSVLFPETLVHCVLLGYSFTHLVTAVAGGQSAIVIPNKNMPFKNRIIIPLLLCHCICAIRFLSLNATGRLDSALFFCNFYWFSAVFIYFYSAQNLHGKSGR